MKPYKTRLVVQVAASLAIAVVALIPPTITGWIVDRVLAPQEGTPHDVDSRLRLLGVYVLALVGIRVLSWGLEWMHGWSVAWLGARVTADVRAQLYRRLEMLTLEFYDGRDIGTLTSRVSNDASTLQDFLIRGLPYFLVNSLTLIGIFAIMCSISWTLTLAVALPVPVVWIWALVFWRRMSQLFHRWWQAGASFSAQLNESLSGIREVKAFGREEREIARFDTHNATVLRRTVDTARHRVVLLATMGIVTGVGVLTLWFFGSIKVGEGGLTLGSLIAFYNYLLLVYNPLQWFGQFSDWMTRAFTGAERIFSILDRPAERYEDRQAVHMPRIRGHVVFRDADFGYDTSRPVLHKFNLEVMPGETIGIVGKSGAGKTTAMNLLCRFYEVDNGSIEIDGVDIRKIRLEDLRSQIGIVLQEPALFSGTIAENISYGKPGASLDEIVEAARIANAHDFILGKRDAYDAEVGEGGKNLSVGERQRIAIARAILRDPRILILDEPTSSVDALNEKAIQDAIYHLAKSRTSFVIAHRLSTLKHVDRLVVLDRGSIRESGTYDELMAQRGLFHGLVHLQEEPPETAAVAG